jgi:hypothetical protein
MQSARSEVPSRQLASRTGTESRVVGFIDGSSRQ